MKLSLLLLYDNFNFIPLVNCVARHLFAFARGGCGTSEGFLNPIQRKTISKRVSKNSDLLVLVNDYEISECKTHLDIKTE